MARIATAHLIRVIATVEKVATMIADAMGAVKSRTPYMALLPDPLTKSMNMDVAVDLVANQMALDSGSIAKDQAYSQAADINQFLPPTHLLPTQLLVLPTVLPHKMLLDHPTDKEDLK